MSLFAVIADSPKPGFFASLKEICPDHRQLYKSEAALLVNFDGSAQDLYDRASIPPEEASSILIAQITADYYGLGNKAFWDWLAGSFREGGNG